MNKEAYKTYVNCLSLLPSSMNVHPFAVHTRYVWVLRAAVPLFLCGGGEAAGEHERRHRGGGQGAAVVLGRGGRGCGPASPHHLTP